MKSSSSKLERAPWEGRVEEEGEEEEGALGEKKKERKKERKSCEKKEKASLYISTHPRPLLLKWKSFLA